MSITPAFLDELRNRVSLSAIVGRKVTWDMKKTNQAKGDWWAPCPFHLEKSASFHVDDRKGFYYCFGCHAKGDLISFVRETENVEFIGAVEILAREAGMQMPARDPEAARQAEKRASLADVMEMAVRHYRANLSGARAREARAYLEGRGLTAGTIDRFGIGFAPDARHDMLDHLNAKGVSEEMAVECGLAIRPDDGGQPYDRFRGRIMFPIRDGRGRCISFGGRAMSPEARAKYLNGNDTALFHKGQTLFNLDRAREAAGKTNRLIVAEGYMDVIALDQAGFSDAVAPLGTAVTPEQLHLMWRLVPEPVIALDGDAAGLRAAHRLIDLALPLLGPERALRFLILPKGQDPDDLIRSDGPSAFAALLDRTRSLVDLLWERETEGRPVDSPERRAAIDMALRKALERIEDRNLRRHYADAIRERRATLFGQWQRQGRGAAAGRRAFGRAPVAEGPLPSTRATALASGAGQADARVRESAILYGCLNHPALALKFEPLLERMVFACADLGRMRDALLAALADGAGAPLTDRVAARVGDEAIAGLEALGQVRINPYLSPSAEEHLAERAIAEDIARQIGLMGMDQELRDMARLLDTAPEEPLSWRIAEASSQRDRALRGRTDGDGEDETDRKLSETLSSFVENQIWIKKR
ncbi:MAG: DNA primase [Rubricella sp.]